MNWGSQSWENSEPQEYVNFAHTNMPRTTWMPPGVTKRFLFMDDLPFLMYEHGLFDVTGRATDKTICLAKNGLDPNGCPCCDGKLYPRYLGYFSVCNLGTVEFNSNGSAQVVGYVSQKGILYQFDVEAYGARVGTQKAPGFIQTIKRQIAKRGGNLAGCVFDITRSGPQAASSGDQIEFVEFVPREHWQAYITQLGADDPRRGTDVDLNIRPLDWHKVMTPHTYAELTAVMRGYKPKAKGFGQGANQGGQGANQGGSARGASYGAPGGGAPANGARGSTWTPQAAQTDNGGAQARNGGAWQHTLPPQDDDIPF